MNGNTLNLSEIEQRLVRIRQLGDTVENALKGISQLINENVNTGKGVFDGTAATQFMEKWQELDKELPGFIQDIKRQATNVEVTIKEAREADVY